MLPQAVVRLAHACPICEADAWLPLPSPAAGRSMLSDGSVLEKTLEKCTCSGCGLVRHVEGPGEDDIQSYFGPSYALGDGQPNIGFEGERQTRYAGWITRALGEFRPGSILELGCGNGALLKELITRFPAAEITGVESSDRAVSWARKSGLPVHAAYISGETSLRGFSADLVLSVNVIEHTPCPARFLRSATNAVRGQGLVLIVCPDGGEVSSELLIYDHLYSFCPSNLLALANASGLAVVGHDVSPPELPGFQMLLGTPKRAGSPAGRQDSTEVKCSSVCDLHNSRVSYLNKWKEFDAKLCGAIAGCRNTVMFGVGEMAQLIRAYAPLTWDRTGSFVVDTPLAAECFGRPVVPYSEYKPHRNDLVILAVSPASAAKLSARLTKDGHRVLSVNEFLSQ